MTDEREQDLANLREMVRDFLGDRWSEQQIRDVMADGTGGDAAVWGRFAGDLGLASLPFPEEYGGAGAGWTEVGIVLEEAGRALFCSPYFASVVLGGAALLASGDERACARYLPGIADGSRRATLAAPEVAGYRPGDQPRVTATRMDGAWTLDGHVAQVVDGATAELVLVVAETGAGTALFAVTGEPARTPLTTLDLTRPLARLDFRDTPAELVGAEGAGAEILARVLDVAAIALAAEQAGGAARVVEMAVEYAKVRRQFGALIGSFQAVKHKCAEMLMLAEGARATARTALDALDRDDPEVPLLARITGVYCSDAFVRCATENIHVHGGIGYTWEHPAHLWFKRAQGSRLLLGDPASHLERIAELTEPSGLDELTTEAATA
ncbi:acyl-CoA dehydrogenase family protein [Pseudonocardia ailaonensis]|uniref:Acyl-CoA dehydrogenase family protein n=1 Tax=Pseudonocardia ailaonensis TaxID=367279 RepID=A0ABN2N483_9PSEU